MTLDWSVDLFVGELCEAAIEIKRLARQSKTKVLFTDPAKRGNIYTTGIPWDQVAHRYPGAVHLNALLAAK